MSIHSIAGVDANVLNFDVAIVGSGPAGLAIATELLSTNLRVAVLESGGLDRQSDRDQLNAFETAGHVRAPHETVGCRVFGGASALWTGRCGPLDLIDYQARPWLAMSGWPIEAGELSVYAQRAGAFLGLAPASAELSAAELRKPFDEPPFDDALFKSVVWQFSRSIGNNEPEVRHFTPEGNLPDQLLQHTGAPTPAHVGLRTQAALRASRSVHVLTDATVSEIRADAASGRVTGLIVLKPDGKPVELNAPCIVLACGGIQNPRLLLTSRAQKPNGLGNDHDQVGRYLTDHTFSVIATYPNATGRALRRRLGVRWHPRLSSERVFCLGLRLSEEAQRDGELLNASVHVIEHGLRLNPLSRLAEGVRSWRAGSVGPALNDLASALSHPVGLAVSAQERFVHKCPPLNSPDRSIVGCVVEQELQPDSRVTLSQQTDRLGLPVPRIDWRLSEREFRTVRAVVEKFRSEALRLGLGPHAEPGWLQGGFAAWGQDLIDLAHPSCTTRMSKDPAAGVVDDTCQVHGVSGLYVAGSSIFPTNSHMNPTQTLVALAIRLADHIKTQVRSGDTVMEIGPTQRPVRLGFIGGGHRVETIYAPVVRALGAGVEVCGVVTRSAEGAERIAARTGWSSGTDLQQLLTTGKPDLLIVAVPPGEVDSIYPQLIDLGIPLFLETPFCWNERAGRKLLKAIEGRQLLVGVAEQFPSLPNFQLMPKLIGLGLIGAIRSVANDFAIYDYHAMAVLRSLTGREHRPLTAQASRLTGSARGRALKGAIACGGGSSLLHTYSPDGGKPTYCDQPSVCVQGTKGTLLSHEAQFGDAAASKRYAFTRDERNSDLKSLSVQTPDGEVLWNNPFFGHGLNDEQVAVASLLRAMAEAVRHAGVSPYPAWAALEDVELINALSYSADRNGKVVALPADPLKQKILKRLQL